MLRINKQGFTLIELMVVIVIIGVLASLAIPRFTEASAKAKAAEAPRVLASFESAYLAAVAEGADDISANIIFKEDAVTADSKWFSYKVTATGSGTSGDNCTATTDKAIGKATTGSTLTTTYNGTTDDTFTHGGTKLLTDLIPNFLRDGETGT